MYLQKRYLLFYEDKFIIVASIASLQAVKNIRKNMNVCISFIDVLVQKGFQVKGTASIIDNTNEDFLLMNNKLIKMTGGNFPFSTVTKIKVEEVKLIIAPKYMLFPDTTEKEQIEGAKKAYNI